jgi:hypothetical protein
MKNFNVKNRLIIISTLLICLIAIASFVIIKKSDSKNPKYKIIDYTGVQNSKLEPYQSPDYYKSRYDGQMIKWQGKISSYYSQISGIKFCVFDNAHADIDINTPCDWFWAESEETMRADDMAVNPNWDGKWVNYILKYYKVRFDPNSPFYNNLYTITGTVDGIDCGVDSKCVPNIKIINITK